MQYLVRRQAPDSRRIPPPWTAESWKVTFDTSFGSASGVLPVSPVGKVVSNLRMFQSMAGWC